MTSSLQSDSDFFGEVTQTKGILPNELTVGKRTVLAAFFVVDITSSYNALLG